MESKRRIAALICIVLCLLLVLSALLPVIISGAANGTQTKINSLQGQLSSLNDTKKALKAEIASIGDDISQASAQKANLDKQVEALQDEIDVLSELIGELNEDIEFKEAQLEEAQLDIEAQDQLLRARIKATYEAGSVEVSYLDLLLSSGSYTEFLTNMDIVASIVDYDNEVLNKYIGLKEDIAQQKQDIEDYRQLQVDSQNDLQSSQNELKEKIDESNALIDKLKKDKSEVESQYKKLDEEEAQMRSQIKKLMEELNRSNYVGGTFMWPTPGITKITSPYGMRNHPITGVYKLHTGVDIGAGYGVHILAANSGTVVTAGFNNAYGNYVVIDHGGGYATLYAHMSKIVVSKGAKVVKGDHIGNVGSTGYSTGNHLHFEIIKNGSTIDPMTQFTKSSN